MKIQWFFDFSVYDPREVGTTSVYRKPLGYGWFRTGLPQTLDGLTALPTASLVATLNTAITNRVIPATVTKLVPQISNALDDAEGTRSPCRGERAASAAQGSVGGLSKKQRHVAVQCRLGADRDVDLVAEDRNGEPRFGKIAGQRAAVCVRGKEVRRQDRVGAEIDLLDGERLVGGRVLGHLEVADEVGVAVLVLNEIVAEFGGRKLGKSARS